MHRGTLQPSGCERRRVCKTGHVARNQALALCVVQTLVECGSAVRESSVIYSGYGPAAVGRRVSRLARWASQRATSRGWPAC